MIKPDYQAGSIVNLMTSIAQGLGVEPYYYPSLPALEPKEIASRQNVILLVIDGLGLTFLKEHAANSFISQNIQQQLTSVFPSTTASAISTFATALAPQQHAITGWHMYFQALNQVLAVLPFVPRMPNSDAKYDMQTMRGLVNFDPLMARVQREKYVISPQYIIDSNFNQIISANANRIGYENLKQCFSEIVSACKSSKQKKYIYAYWPEFDATCHSEGTNSEETLQLFENLNAEFIRLTTALQSENFMLILTADHGLINTDDNKTIMLNDFPDIYSCLEQPLCGEPRSAYCYVKKGLEAIFERRVNAQLSNYLELVRSQQLIDENFFGLNTVTPAFQQRIGDYVLIMKGNYIIRDILPEEKRFTQRAVHGGISPEEMLVPLVIFKN